MKKVFVLVISIALLVYINVSFAAEYTMVIGKVISINLKDSSIKVDVYSKRCTGIHTFSIQNDEVLKKLKEHSNIALYLVKDCEEAIVITGE
ncbi:hypothetical protein [Desulfurella multipotens]|uniref:Uncharacterized protein n=1 Tax=Desulfurella multipotens TaxID=79269 RepID=A0A1G6JQT5_9BACT|nr:hypothetical protein [Desulfurella multipotens]PMP62771.1 MAG: hypothetical protein C0192_08555 [Desulfurella multipotens]SDC21089.1 hypothetical protein SAMN05660835_00458 [Desulfurella multipotens]